VGARVLEAIVASAIFDSVYAAILHTQVAVALLDLRGYVAGNVVPVVVVFLLGGVVIPYAAAWVIYGQVPLLAGVSERWNRSVRPKLTRSQQTSDTATAWDYGNKSVIEGWVRVRIAEGVWVGGVFDENSRFSTYPESRDLFVTRQWKMDRDGEFVAEVVGTQGVWLAVKDDYVVEWLLDQRSNDDEQLAAH